MNNIQGALQIHHAVTDLVVSIECTRNLRRLLEPSPVTYKVYEYATGGHDIEGDSFDQAMQRTVEFYKQNV